MAERIAGSIKSVIFAGIQITPLGETSIEIPKSIYKKESVSTSGDPITKFILDPQTIENHDYGMSAKEYVEIAELSNIPISQEVNFELVDGVTISGQCFVDVERYKTMDAVSSIGFRPTKLDNWEWSV